MPRTALWIAALLACLPLGGCPGSRVVLDIVPAENDITETEVLRDPGYAGSRAKKVALIDVSGIMVTGRQQSLVGAGENPVSTFAESLKRAEEDRKVAAVIVRLNSPGGTVTASDVMYNEVLRFKERSGKPVVMFMSEVAASGAFYLSCAGDEVIAQPTSITGSIGVIIQTINVSEGMQRIGIRGDAITSGDNKAMGSPFEPMRPEHRALFQDIVDEFYAGFRGIVLERRPDLDPSIVDDVTDGRIVTGRQAAEAGLIDATGDLRDAFVAAKRLGDVPHGRLVKYHRPIEFVGSPYSRSASPTTTELNLVQVRLDGLRREQPGFYYLWDPWVW